MVQGIAVILVRLFHSGALEEERGNLESCVFFLFYEGWIIFNGQFFGLI